ncbi:MAG: thioredoxin fold domain-containing protein [gamma proteobacterium symbiont of Bathyaustriella thionipta]|nr:thioredoxin fold domain-containing protein [gamma proteobacterium symbiont of Bathyaustriella thionipta]
MKYALVAFFLLCMNNLMAAAAPHADELEAGLHNPGYHEKPDWFLNSFLNLADDLHEAEAEGKRLLLYFYQDGCPYCAKLLDENFSDKSIVAKTRKHFAVLPINIWGDRELVDFSGNRMTEKQFAERLRVMYTPSLLFLDERAYPVLRLNGYYPAHQFSVALDYALGKFSAGQSFNEYLAQLDPVQASGLLHVEDNSLAPPLKLNKKADRPLLVLFEQPQCRDCDVLHDDILQREAVRHSFLEFNRLVLNMWSDDSLITPAGKKTSARQWARDLHINYAPTLVYFDRNGQEVFRSEAWLKAFHQHAAMDYVLSGAYKKQPNFQRYIQSRADAMRARGEVVEIMQ